MNFDPFYRAPKKGWKKMGGNCFYNIFAFALKTSAFPKKCCLLAQHLHFSQEALHSLAKLLRSFNILVINCKTYNPQETVGLQKCSFF